MRWEGQWLNYEGHKGHPCNWANTVRVPKTAGRAHCRVGERVPLWVHNKGPSEGTKGP